MARTLAIELRKLIRTPVWFAWFMGVVGIALAVYLVDAYLGRPHAGSPWGRAYGTVSALLMLGAALYGARRRLPRPNLGGSSTWVRFHIYGGSLALLLMIMHTGFRAPSGAMNWWLWILSVWVVVGGLLGVVLQKWIPRTLTSGLSIEVLYQRIPELVDELRERAEKLVESSPEPIAEFYRRRIAAQLAGPQTRLMYFIDITGGIQTQIRHFDYMRRFLSDAEKETLDRLQSVYRTKLELDAHYTLQKALRYWLYAHVPVSIVLLLLVALHVFLVLYY